MPPQHTDNAVIDVEKRLVGRRQGPILLLSVKPELAHAFDMVQAVDKNSAMVDSVWPCDSAFKRARLGGWLQLEHPDGSFPAVIGDGSLNDLTFPDDISRLIGAAVRHLSPGELFACGLFERSEVPISNNAYRRSPLSCCFPDRPEFLSTLQDGIADVAFRDCGNCPLASCSPILTFRNT